MPKRFLVFLFYLFKTNCIKVELLLSMKYFFFLSLELFISVPNRPKCSDVTENVTVSSRTNESITLNFTKLMTEDRICVQPQDEEHHRNCRPAYNTVPFDKLIPSTLYKFSVYSYINDSVEGMLYSEAGCPFMRYTCKFGRFLHASILTFKTFQFVILSPSVFHHICRENLL